jgi:hypothetical protein
MPRRVGLLLTPNMNDEQRPLGEPDTCSGGMNLRWG